MGVRDYQRSGEVLRTLRLELVPMRLAIVEAVLLGQRHDAEVLTGAVMPDRWPNTELVERAFSMTLDAVRKDPAARLWGARVIIARTAPTRPTAQISDTRRVVGSLVYKGAPDESGIVEIAYGIEEASQGLGYATEGVGASVAWALAQPGARAVHASTFAWHRASVRVLEKVGMTRVGVRDHDTMGEMLVFGISPPTPPQANASSDERPARQRIR